MAPAAPSSTALAARYFTVDDTVHFPREAFESLGSALTDRHILWYNSTRQLLECPLCDYTIITQHSRKYEGKIGIVAQLDRGFDICRLSYGIDAEG